MTSKAENLARGAQGTRTKAALLPNKRIHAAWPSWALVLGSVLVFFGERVFSGATNTRYTLAVLAALFLIVGLFGRAYEVTIAKGTNKTVAQSMLWGSLGVLVSIIFYALIPLVFDGDTENAARSRAVLWGVWPVLFLCSAAMLIAMEVAIYPSAFLPNYELARVINARNRGAGLALFVACLVFLNLLVARHDKKWDLSFGHSATAGDKTQRAIRELTKDLRVVLFFPRANEVGEAVTGYFEPLQKLAGPRLKIERVDYALAPELAKDAAVTENGYVALFQDNARDRIRIGTDMQNARSNLRRLDDGFLKSLIKVTTERKVAYFTAGHAERANTAAKGPRLEEDQRDPVQLIQRQLEAWQYAIHPLGLAQGLGEKVPTDGLVFVMGPEKPFLPAEIEALTASYAKKGTRMLLALEAERDGEALNEVLAPLGLRFEKSILANLANFAQVTRTERDVNFVWSNRYSSHEVVSTMTRSRLPTLMYRSGALRGDNTKKLPNAKVDIVLTALDDTFQDANDNLKFDSGEKKENFGLVAAVTLTSTTGKKEDEGRIYVIADVDTFSDKMLQMNQGNFFLFADAVYWLGLKAEPVLPTVSEADIKIIHRKDEDALSFYGTTFGVPLLILAIGFFGIRRRKTS